VKDNGQGRDFFLLLLFLISIVIIYLFNCSILECLLPSFLLGEVPAQDGMGTMGAGCSEEGNDTTGTHPVVVVVVESAYKKKM